MGEAATAQDGPARARGVRQPRLRRRRRRDGHADRRISSPSRSTRSSAGSKPSRATAPTNSIMRNLIADALLATDGYADADFLGDRVDAPAQGDLRPEGRALLPVGAAFGGQAALRRHAAHHRYRQHAELELGHGDRAGRHCQRRPSARRRRAGDGARQPDPRHRRAPSARTARQRSRPQSRRRWAAPSRSTR